MTHLVLLSLCAYRIWRFVGKDDITAPLRRPLKGFVLKGVTCAWCGGSWITAALVGWDHHHPVPTWLLVLGAAATLVGLLDGLDDRLAQ